MAKVEIESVGELNSQVLALKLKAETAFTYNLEAVNSILGSIPDYKATNGFSAFVSLNANKLKNNLINVLDDMNAAKDNIFNYAAIIDQLNINDYDTSSTPVDLYGQYAPLYDAAILALESGENGEGTDSSAVDPILAAAAAAGVGATALGNATLENADGTGEETGEVDAGAGASDAGSSTAGTGNEGGSASSGSSNSDYSGSGSSSSGSSDGTSSSDNNQDENKEEPTNPETENNQTPDTELEKYLDTVPGTEVEKAETMTVSEVSKTINYEDNSMSAYTVSILNGTVYNEEGIGLFQERYVISVSPEYGQIGDFIDIKQADGTILRCIIGDIQESVDPGNISFMVNQELLKDSVSALHPNWLQDVTSINNKGNYFEYFNSGLIS